MPHMRLYTYVYIWGHECVSTNIKETFSATCLKQWLLVSNIFVVIEQWLFDIALKTKKGKTGIETCDWKSCIGKNLLTILINTIFKCLFTLILGLQDVY